MLRLGDHLEDRLSSELAIYRERHARSITRIPAQSQRVTGVQLLDGGQVAGNILLDNRTNAPECMALSMYWTGVQGARRLLIRFLE